MHTKNILFIIPIHVLGSALKNLWFRGLFKLKSRTIVSPIWHSRSQFIVMFRVRVWLWIKKKGTRFAYPAETDALLRGHAPVSRIVANVYVYAALALAIVSWTSNVNTYPWAWHPRLFIRFHQSNPASRMCGRYIHIPLAIYISIYISTH